MAAFNGHTNETHNTPHDVVPFQLPPKGKETRKALTAALQFVLSDLQYAQRQEYSKAKHYATNGALASTYTQASHVVSTPLATSQFSTSFGLACSSRWGSSPRLRATKW